ncbi:MULTISPECIES: dihydroorotase [unclassified Tolypothrix]|uniref:dihydroorotase n=1 Tax=unclassified Tolypothrix TaxID=2649714 RepID=UPI0005EAB57C|nr:MULTISPECIES: dihydroorotase [unclassified Tolypothrix]BAY93179.1 dihydroorotase [Microchaete diplosiphon NIES-3275]EKF00447.1 amidohydrolase family protein [Tolypothrix sp. PCC 7601]MBE9082939.1 dihydroorotase [Tolypothrix sp. LEGE 11397]UYD27054.1 dihydroorotase [Tolypothrix sp. PCC 7712]UYD37088.1 dihydroorotase [Tolypothrix sp. PCC 7601]
MTTELLQQVRVIDPVSGTDQLTDVLIADGYIQAIAAHITDVSSDTQIKDCRGLILGPGLVDLYSHSGEPGFEERETISSLLQAAAAGGFTRISILPNTSPVIDNPAVVAQLQKMSQQREASSLSSPPLPHLQTWGAMTLDLAGKQLTELADLAAAGVVGFTDAVPRENLGLVRRVLEYLLPIGKPVAFWPCDQQLTANGVMREGPDAIRLGLPPIPASAETSAIAALLELVAATGNSHVHIMRVSTARSVDLIASAKASGLPITASTTWMHLLLDTKSVKSYHTSLHLDPPLGNPSDVKALREGVRTGIIDAIAIEHAPFTYEEKVQAFAEAPPGAIGYELALPLLWQHLVDTGEFTALELWRALSTRSAECLRDKLQAIAPHQKAELTLFDPQQNWKVESKNLHTLSSNTPWLGQQLQGRVVQIWC